MKCGTAVAEAAPPPSPERGAADYTPRHLAQKILTSRSALEGERKQVTVLFADVKSSVELSSALDPEEWHGVLDGFFQILAEGVHRFEGTVNQYTGDGIMALFGAPIAHEDHAQRACYAALHLRDALRDYTEELKRERGLAFSVRMALNSGEVVVGKIGDDLRMDYTAQGLTVGLASRLQELCGSGQVYASEHTAALVSGYFALRDLGAFRLKGVADPVGTFELTGLGALRSRFELSRARGLSRFVGRVEELAALEAALDRALAGRGGVVGVVAEAGVGKSRLCFEFTERCRARGIPVYEGHAVSYGRSVPLVPVRHMIRSFFGVSETDSEAEARRKIAGTLVLLDDAFRESLPLLLYLLGTPDPMRSLPSMDPAVRQRRTLEFLRQLVRTRSQHEPAVVFMEDLHWLDPGSEEMMPALVDGAEGTRTLLLVNFRPEFRAEWMERACYESIALTPLGPETTAELLRELLGDHPSVLPLIDRIQERTAGNPLFTEEVVRALAGSGVLEGERGAHRLAGDAGSLRVPESVQALLSARIDALPEDAKSLLQTVSVVGETASVPVLERATGLAPEELDRRLEVLRRREFLYESALYPDREVSFAHPLTQEVAYRSQLGEVRRRVHAAVATAIEDLEPESLESRAALLARHWDLAGEALRAARWYERVASSAQEWRAQVQMESWQRIRELLSGLPEPPETLALRVRACIGVLFAGWRLVIPEEEARRIYDEGTRIAVRTGDDQSRVELNSAYALLRSFHGDFAAQFVLLNEALSWVTEETELPVSASIHQRVSWTHLMAGDISRALDHAERGLALCGDGSGAGHVGGFSSYGALLAQRGVALARSGRVEEGALDIDRALRTSRSDQDEVMEMMATAYASEVAGLRGDLDAQLEHASRCVEVSEHMGSPTWRNYGSVQLALAHVARGEWARAREQMERVERISAEVGLRPFGPFYLLRAAAELGCGNPDRARALLEEARLRVGETGPVFTGAMALLAARVAHELADPDQRSDDAADLRAVRDELERQGHRATLPMVHLELAERARDRGDGERRRQELVRARTLFEEMGLVDRVRAVDAALGS